MKIDLSDWRNQFVGKQAGTDNDVIITAMARWIDGRAITFVMPSPSSLMLNAAFSAYERALTARGHVQVITEDKLIRNTSDVYDYVQSYFESTIFAFTSIEVTCNLHIQKEHELVVEGSKSTETYRGEQIERWVHLDDKIEFVANTLGSSIDKSTGTWNRYKSLSKNRDRLIHLKNSDRESHNPDEDKVWAIALQPNPINPCEVAIEVLNLLYARKKKPDWLKAANEFIQST